jgi:molybdate transport system substrate-binding protein
MRSVRVVVAFGAFAAFASACGSDSSNDAAEPVREITIAAASDLRPAFQELGALFTDSSGTAVTFSFGSSGQLREQIINGAPFDLFASANVAFVDAVIEAGRGVASTTADYAFGRIVVWTSGGVPLPATIEELADPVHRRIAIANPEHAPYGVAAQQALRSAGIYDEVVDRLVYGENVSDAFRIAQSGNADIGIVALSLAIADGSDYTLIPEELHEPLQQALVVTSTGPAGAAATAFADFVSSPAGREVMVRYGFVLPGELPQDTEG